MRAKLCIISNDEDRIKAYLIPENKRKAATKPKVVWLERHRFPKEVTVQNGNVYDVDYTMRHLAVYGLTEDKFFPVTVTAVQEVVYSGYQIAENVQAANEEYIAGLTHPRTQDFTISRSECVVKKIEV